MGEPFPLAARVRVIAALEHAHGRHPQRRHLGSDPREVVVLQRERSHLVSIVIVSIAIVV